MFSFKKKIVEIVEFDDYSTSFLDFPKSKHRRFTDLKNI